MNAAGSSEPAAIESVPANAPVSPGAAESLTPGELLRRERERRSISLLQAAEDLHLDTRVVEAIEANRFDLLGAPVYARGHLKKYAALMGLSPEFVIERHHGRGGGIRAASFLQGTVAGIGLVDRAGVGVVDRRRDNDAIVRAEASAVAGARARRTCGDR
jgi:hypothetical protein